MRGDTNVGTGTLAWLTARPVAHRGLHDAAAGVIENTPSAFSAAIAGNYAIECDIQVTADGEGLHDVALTRCTRVMAEAGPTSRSP